MSNDIQKKRFNNFEARRIWKLAAVLNDRPVQEEAREAEAGRWAGVGRGGQGWAGVGRGGRECGATMRFIVHPVPRVADCPRCDAGYCREEEVQRAMIRAYSTTIIRETERVAKAVGNIARLESALKKETTELKLRRKEFDEKKEVCFRHGLRLVVPITNAVNGVWCES